MAEMKRIVCLANSRKTSGRCLAGKELGARGPGQWIRPVSSRPTQEVSLEERRYEDGTDPALLDIIDVPLLNATLGSFQVENWLLDPDQYWKRMDRLPVDELPRFLDALDKLWLNGFSTGAGLNDRVPEAEAAKLRGSLYLLTLKAAKLSVFAPGTKRRVQTRFKYSGVEYRIWVTDPVVERTYLARKDNDYDIGECYATVSLGEAFEGYCYKLVAAVILPG